MWKVWKGSEDELQAALFDRLKDWSKSLVFAEYLDWVYAVPNGGLRTKRGAGLLKATGTKSGVSDVICQFPSIVDDLFYSSFSLELKDHKGIPSSNQLKFQNFQNSKFGKIAISNSLPEAEYLIMEYVVGAIKMFSGKEFFIELIPEDAIFTEEDWNLCGVESRDLKLPFDPTTTPKHSFKIMEI